MSECRFTHIVELTSSYCKHHLGKGSGSKHHQEVCKQHEHSIFVVDVFCYSFTKGATNLVVDVYGDGEVADTAWLCK